MEASNVKAMREVLEKMGNLFEQGVICTSYANSAEEMEQIEELYRNAKAALAEPPRNCDVGTADEQGERFERFCHAAGWDNCSKTCPLYAHSRNRDDCAIQWAQMPYEEGGAK